MSSLALLINKVYLQVVAPRLCSIQPGTSDCALLPISRCSVQGRLPEGEAGLGIQLHLNPSDKEKKSVCSLAEPEVRALWIFNANNDCFGMLI